MAAAKSDKLRNCNGNFDRSVNPMTMTSDGLILG